MITGLKDDNCTWILGWLPLKIGQLRVVANLESTLKTLHRENKWLIERDWFWKFRFILFIFCIE